MVTVDRLLELTTEDDDHITLNRYTNAYYLEVETNYSTNTGKTIGVELTFEEGEKLSKALGGQ
jgi:hypothetical protein